MHAFSVVQTMRSTYNELVMVAIEVAMPGIVALPLFRLFA